MAPHAAEPAHTTGPWDGAQSARGTRAPGDVIGAVLDELGLGYERPEPGAYLVRLEGEHKLATMTWLIAGQHSLQVEAFFCRQPDENHAAFYRFLLERNGRMYGVHFALDRIGDVYLTARLPLSAISEQEIDRLLGCVLAYSDESFNEALKIGFGSAIRREWAWREKRGESLANLRAFADFATTPNTTAPDTTAPDTTTPDGAAAGTDHRAGPP
jgi:Putative bacterial sensory transduction regulator